MSKGMGLNLLRSLNPLSAEVGEQLMKMGGGGAKGFMHAARKAFRSFGGFRGLTNYWRGMEIGSEGGIMKWGAGKNMLGFRQERQATMYAIGGLAAMNIVAPDSTVTNAVTTAATVTAGAWAGGPAWRAAAGAKNFWTNKGARAGMIGLAGWYGLNKSGIV